MRHGSGAVVRRPDRRPGASPLAMAAGLVLVGRFLVDELGSPVRLLRALGDLGDPWADPVAPMISLLALLAETLVAYILVVLALRSLCLLPGPVGRAAGQVTRLVTPVALRRVLDLLVGGTLLAQATLVAGSGVLPGQRAAVPALAMATASVSSGQAALVTGPDPGPSDTGAVTDPVETRPARRRSSAPLPPWLGGGPSNPAPAPTGEPAPGPAGEAAPGSGGTPERGPSDGVTGGYTVAVGDTLWDIAATHLGPGERTVANVHRYWRQVYQANRRAVGADPDLIHPGTRLQVPPFRRDRP